MEMSMKTYKAFDFKLVISKHVGFFPGSPKLQTRKSYIFGRGSSIWFIF